MRLGVCMYMSDRSVCVCTMAVWVLFFIVYLFVCLDFFVIFLGFFRFVIFVCEPPFGGLKNSVWRVH